MTLNRRILPNGLNSPKDMENADIYVARTDQLYTGAESETQIEADRMCRERLERVPRIYGSVAGFYGSQLLSEPLAGI